MARPSFAGGLRGRDMPARQAPLEPGLFRAMDPTLPARPAKAASPVGQERPQATPGRTKNYEPGDARRHARRCRSTARQVGATLTTTEWSSEMEGASA